MSEQMTPRRRGLRTLGQTVFAAILVFAGDYITTLEPANDAVYGALVAVLAAVIAWAQNAHDDKRAHEM
jgi:drug/metabolite transporter (DMT)-like permease